MSRYSDKIWRLFREPRRVGRFESTEQVFSGQARTPASHAELHVHLQLAEDGRIDDALFQALGCPSLIATGAWLCGWLIGRKADAVRSLQSALIVEQLELSALKRYCAVMAVDALNQALDQASNNETSQGAETGAVKPLQTMDTADD